MSSTDNEALVHRAVLDWIKEDAPIGIKMQMTPDLANKLSDRIAHRRASQAAPAPSDGLREAWIAGRDAAAAEAFYACGCKDSIEALTPPDALSASPAQEGVE